MALAWSTVAILFVLIPGYSFYLGLFSTRQYSYDVAPKNIINQLATIIMSSVFVHTLMIFLTNIIYLSGYTPKVSLPNVMKILQMGSNTVVNQELDILTNNVSIHFFWIIGYTMLASIVGTWLGSIVIRNAVFFAYKTKNENVLLRFLGNISGWLLVNEWIYSFVEIDNHKQANSSSFAYILSKVSESGVNLVYKGVIKDFSLNKDGKINYILLSSPSRSLLSICKTEENAIDPKKFLTLTTKPVEIGRSSSSKQNSDIFISGDEIANIVFTSYEFKEKDSNISAEDMSRAIKKMNEVFSQYKDLFSVDTETSEKGYDHF